LAIGSFTDRDPVLFLFFQLFGLLWLQMAGKAAQISVKKEKEKRKKRKEKTKYERTQTRYLLAWIQNSPNSIQSTNGDV
jgi:hypothetical protein